jgi:hypothetical protein
MALASLGRGRSIAEPALVNSITLLRSDDEYALFGRHYSTPRRSDGSPIARRSRVALSSGAGVAP